MWATIIIAESLTRIMGSTTDNVYSTTVAVVSCSITLRILVGGAEFPTGRPAPLPPLPLAPALTNRPIICFLEVSNLVSCNLTFQSTHYWIPKIQDG